MLESNRWLAREWEAQLLRALRTGTLPVAALTQLALAAQPFAPDEALDLDQALALGRWLPPFWQDPDGQQPFVGAPVLRLDPTPRDVPSWPPRPATMAWRRAEDGALILAAADGLEDLRHWASGLAALGRLHARAQQLWGRWLAGAGVGGEAADAPARAHRRAEAWGVPAEAVVAATASQPALVAALAAAPWPAPRVWCPPGLRVGRRPAAESTAPQALCDWLADAGLTGRPLHLWLGPSLLPACLAPAARDLAAHLPRFVAAEAGRRAALGPPPSPEDVAAWEGWHRAAAELLATTTVDVAAERRRVDRTVGIWRQQLGRWRVTLCDTAQLDLAATDRRLAAPAAAPPPPAAPVVVVVDHCGASDRARLLGLLAGWGGTTLASVTALFPTVLAAGGERRPSRPAWAYAPTGGGLRPVPQAPLALPEGLLAPPGLVWWSPAAVLAEAAPQALVFAGASGTDVGALAAMPRAVAVGDGELLEQFDELRLTGRLAATCRAHWVAWPGRLPHGEVLPPDPDHARLLGLSAAVGAGLWSAGPGSGPLPPAPEPDGPGPLARLAAQRRVRA